MPTTIEKSLEASFVKWCRDHEIAALKGPVGLSKGFPDRFAMLPTEVARFMLSSKAQATMTSRKSSGGGKNIC